MGRAAANCGVHERTLRRWLIEDEAFKADYQAARRATFVAGVNRIHALVARAVEALDDLLEARQHPAVRLGATPVQSLTSLYNSTMPRQFYRGSLSRSIAGRNRELEAVNASLPSKRQSTS